MELNETEPNVTQGGQILLMIQFGFYSVLFSFGFFGNLAVILAIGNLILMKPAARSPRRTPSHIFIYVLGLSITDFLFISHVPFLCINIYYGTWIFGNSMCKLYYFIESVTKIVSTFILTAMSWDRFLGICKPHTSQKYRSQRVAVLVIIGSFLLSFLLFMPLHLNSMATPVYVGFNRSTEMTACSDGMGANLTKIFTSYIFICAHLIPAVAMAVFYAVSLSHLRNSSRVCSEKSRLSTVTNRIIVLILFYFFCWSPYWAWTISYLVKPTLAERGNLVSVIVGRVVLSLPYLNSAVNPILYAVLNKELRTTSTAALESRRRSLAEAKVRAIETIVTQKKRVSRHFSAENSSITRLSSSNRSNSIESETARKRRIRQLVKESTIRELTNEISKTSEHKSETRRSSEAIPLRTKSCDGLIDSDIDTNANATLWV